MRLDPLEAFSIDTTFAKRARTISNPGSAATPAEYWNTPLMKRYPPCVNFETVFPAILSVSENSII
jgi:hypothetical protein